MCSGLNGSVYSLNRHDAEDQLLKDRVHQRILDRSTVEDGCHIYNGCEDKRGRARIKVGCRTYSLPKVIAWLFVRGFELWDSRVPYHTCLNPACADPNHIAIASNQAERLAKERSKVGRTHASRPGARPGEQKVAVVLAAYAASPNATVRQLARRFDLTTANVTDSLRRIRP